MFGAQRRSPVSFGADVTLGIAPIHRQGAKARWDQEAPSRRPIPALDCTLFGAWEVVLKLAVFDFGDMGRFIRSSIRASKERLFNRKLSLLGRERIIHIAVMYRLTIRETMQAG